MCKSRRSLPVACGIIWLIPGVLTALTGALQYIPADSRLYEDVDLLKTAGLIQTLPSTSRPWTRAEFCQLLEEAESLASGRRLNPTQQTALKRLRSELTGRQPVLRLPLEPDTVGFDLFSRTAITPEHQQVSLGLRFFNQPADRFFFYQEMEPLVFNPEQGRVRDSSGWHNPGARAVSWRNRLLWQMERAYFGFNLPWLRLELGRDELVWGPGWHSSVMLSDQAPALDKIQLTLSRRQVKFTSFTALLSRWNDRHRFLSAQRLELTVGRRLVLGGAMFNVYNWENAWDFSGMLNPLLPIYFSVANSGHDDNLLVGGDAVLYLPQTRLYAQLLIDNFEFNTRRESPNCLGLQSGCFWAPPLPFDFRAEYALVTAFTYYHRLRDIMYENYSVPLGHELGPDADRLEAKLRFMPATWLNLSIWGDLTRRGYYNRGDYDRLAFDVADTTFLRRYYRFPALGYDYVTGELLEEVERSVRFGPELEFTPLPELYLQLRGGLKFCRNENGAIGVNRTTPELLVRIEYRY
ncbi:MAG: capsule assembly Wzi family protein [candidate division WOR-3 bacterium]